MSGMNEPSVGRAFAAYSLLRLLLFAIVTSVLFLVGLTGLPLLATAVLASAILSFVVLKPQREDLARAVAGRDGDRQVERDAQRAQLELPDPVSGDSRNTRSGDEDSAT